MFQRAWEAADNVELWYESMHACALTACWPCSDTLSQSEHENCVVMPCNTRPLPLKLLLSLKYKCIGNWSPEQCILRMPILFVHQVPHGQGKPPVFLCEHFVLVDFAAATFCGVVGAVLPLIRANHLQIYTPHRCHCSACLPAQLGSDTAQ